MHKKVNDNRIPALDDSDKIYLNEFFLENMVPKLHKLGARLGTINCSSAGEKYNNWNINFRSAGSDFTIVNFEYDEDAASIDLDL